MNHIARILYKMEEARNTVLAMTGLSEEALNEMQYEAAYECLERIIGKDDYGKRELPLNSKFWDWWKDQWYRRDRVFLDRLVYDTELMKYRVRVPQSQQPLVLHNEAHVLHAYKLYHKVEPENNLINSAVLEHSFHRLVSDTKK